MTGIREVDLSRPLEPIEGLTSTRCMLVFRLGRRVVGRTFAHIRDARLEVPEVTALATEALGRGALRAWLDGSLLFDERSVVDPVPLTATVAICTRERPQDLRLALRGVQALAPAPLEVLVVDNDPTSDATRAVVEEFPAATYVLEPERGLNVARNRALRMARGDVVAFTDDDAVPEPEWLGELLANFHGDDILCATGLTLPRVLDTEAQELFEGHSTFVRGFERRVFDGQHDNPLAVGPVGAGANMALRREPILQLGGFDERLDAGRPTRSGGDHEMFTRILRAGYRIAYDPAAVSWHRHRASKAELFDTVYGYGVGVYAMWTGLLLERRELGVLRLAWSWFRHAHLPALLSPWRRDDALALARAELRGCLAGPRAWFEARRLVAARERQRDDA